MNRLALSHYFSELRVHNKMFRFTTASLLIFALSSEAVAERFLQVNSTEPVCNICGDGNMVTIPDAIVSIDGQDDLSCADYEAAAPGLDAEECDLLLQVTSAFCGCAPMSGENTTATEAPGDTDSIICYICGEGMMVTLPDAIVSITSQPDRSCKDYEYGGLAGLIPAGSCGLFLTFTAPCGCAPGNAAPVPPAPPSDAPVAAPTVSETPETPTASAYGFGYRFAASVSFIVFSNTFFL